MDFPAALPLLLLALEVLPVVDDEVEFESESASSACTVVLSVLVLLPEESA